MRQFINFCACLVIFSSSLLATEPTTKIILTDEEPALSTPRKAKLNREKAFVTAIPGKTLAVELNQNKGLLEVNLTGSAEQLDWILFQPKGEVISRISTSTKIDEIKIENLDKGSYMLMVKDKKGRVLYRAFDKA